jgi:hypothetical protein
VACNRQDRKAETAFPPTTQQRLSSRLISCGGEAKGMKDPGRGRRMYMASVEVESYSPERILKRGGAGAIMSPRAPVQDITGDGPKQARPEGVGIGRN